MKLYSALLAQHIGWQFKQIWKVKNNRKIRETEALKLLTEKGVPVYRPQDLFEKKEFKQIEEIPDYIPKPAAFDKTHPNWHDKVCHTYKDNNVLIEGLDQAKIITNTVEIHEGLPVQIVVPKGPSGLDKSVKEIILNSHLFDSEQEKLPKKKDPERPAWNFPRDFGVTQSRFTKLLITRLLQLIESRSDPNIVKQRHIINDLQFWYPFQKDGNLIQLQLQGNALITASKPLLPITNESTANHTLPDIYPIDFTNTLKKEHIYRIQNIYPIEQFIPKSHPHTVFVHYNNLEVKNLYEEEVTVAQFLGRSLMKTFVVAATYARQNFGEEVEVLPQPVTVQCVHTDGRIFHFGILQLNTLDSSSNSTIKNVWYQTPQLALFDTCIYKLGKPILEGYNGNVINNLMALYANA
ncbi:hypothetical protein FQA39_LY07904 [Lamprigera yunnana]|nr:hypothetical protein FQA39_LY07904 [Lamprigera yunnana]